MHIFPSLFAVFQACEECLQLFRDYRKGSKCGLSVSRSEKDFATGCPRSPQCGNGKETMSGHFGTLGGWEEIFGPTFFFLWHRFLSLGLKFKRKSVSLLHSAWVYMEAFANVPRSFFGFFRPLNGKRRIFSVAKKLWARKILSEDKKKKKTGRGLSLLNLIPLLPDQKTSKTPVAHILASTMKTPANISLSPVKFAPPNRETRRGLDFEFRRAGRDFSGIAAYRNGDWESESKSSQARSLSAPEYNSTRINLISPPRRRRPPPPFPI